eukprot:619417-Prorocentrum_minimum.AAC.4
MKPSTCFTGAKRLIVSTNEPKKALTCLPASSTTNLLTPGATTQYAYASVHPPRTKQHTSRWPFPTWTSSLQNNMSDGSRSLRLELKAALFSALPK